MDEVRLGTGRAVEVDERGRPVDVSAIVTRGRLVVGRRLTEERRRDLVAKRAHRKLNLEEMRCLSMVEGEELSQLTSRR